MISARDGVHKVVDNHLQGAFSGDPTRDYFIDRQYPQGTTFVNVETLLKTGRNLREDTIAQGKNPDNFPRKFLDIGEI